MNSSNICFQDTNLIRAATYRSGCYSEWLIHATIIRFALALLVYVCVNISAGLFMAALNRLNWRSLSKQGFLFVGLCTPAG
jgi:hypothetical protein